jgi:endonuclease-3
MDEKVATLMILRKHYHGITMLGSFTDKSPFQILIATVLSARNRDSQTIKVVEKLFPKYPTAEKLAKAPLPVLEELVKRTGFYKVKAARIKELSKILVEKYGGKVPETMEELTSLPGVGNKTAGCTLVYAFNKAAIPVDTHVHRISNRLGWVKTKTPDKTQAALEAIIPKGHWNIVNEVLVLHGQNICAPISPKCSICPIYTHCRRVGVIS